MEKEYRSDCQIHKKKQKQGGKFFAVFTGLDGHIGTDKHKIAKEKDKHNIDRARRT